MLTYVDPSDTCCVFFPATDPRVMFDDFDESRKGGYLAELEASLFSEGLHTLGEKPSTPEMTGAVPAMCELATGAYLCTYLV